MVSDVEPSVQGPLDFARGERAGFARLGRCALALLAAACTPAVTGPSGAADGGAFAVEPVSVEERALDVVVTLPAELTPYEQVDVYPRTSGYVRALKVDRGSVVKRGDLLVQLEAPELTSQRLEAEARVAGERSTVQRLEAAQRQTAGAVAQHDVELADAAQQVSEARAAALRTLEGYLLLTAPFDGVVTERNVHPGALVGPPNSARGVPLLKLETTARLRLTVAVPEGQTSAIAIGEPLEFTVAAWPQRRFSAPIARLGKAVDPRTRTMAVECDVDNADGALTSGMYAGVAWHERRPKPSLFVPPSAVVQGTDKTFVVRLRDGKAEPVPVRRGVTSGGLVEVFGELHAGEVVARRGSEELKAGTPVTPRAPAPASK